MQTIQHPNYPAANFAMAGRRLENITDLIIHHSDGSPNQTPLEIDQEHRAEGWAMVGYSYIIGPDGSIYKGRPDNVVPSAAYGDNAASVDVCLLGDFQPKTTGFQATVPVAQMQSLLDLSVYLHKVYPTIDRTIGHRDVAKDHPDDPGDYATACPGDVLYAELPVIKAYVHKALGK